VRLFFSNKFFKITLFGNAFFCQHRVQACVKRVATRPHYGLLRQLIMLKLLRRAWLQPRKLGFGLGFYQLVKHCVSFGFIGVCTAAMQRNKRQELSNDVTKTLIGSYKNSSWAQVKSCSGSAKETASCHDT